MPEAADDWRKVEKADEDRKVRRGARDAGGKTDKEARSGDF